MRLPATVASEWEIEVSGAVVINEICLAQSMDEIRAKLTTTFVQMTRPKCQLCRHYRQVLALKCASTSKR